MVYFNLHQIAHNLKTYVKSWNNNGLIFSYESKIGATKSQVTLCLHQKETNFSIFMDMEEQKHCLRITRFAMIEDARLESLSDALYDTALIEIVLQALSLVFFCAESQEHEEVVFILPHEEACHLTPLKNSFEKVSSHNTIDGKRTFLTLYTSPYDYDNFVKHANTIKTKVRQELWKLQRTDYFLRQYLQNPRQFLFIELTDLKEQDVPDVKANIIVLSKLVLER